MKALYQVQFRRVANPFYVEVCHNVAASSIQGAIAQAKRMERARRGNIRRTSLYPKVAALFVGDVRFIGAAGTRETMNGSAR